MIGDHDHTLLGKMVDPVDLGSKIEAVEERPNSRNLFEGAHVQLERVKVVAVPRTKLPDPIREVPAQHAQL